MEKLHLDRPLVVEGKYDKNTISQVASGIIVTTGGFSVFHKTQLIDYLRRLAEPNGLLVLMDSDSGGAQIRRYLSSVLPKEKLTHLYIPQVEGKERRKDKRSAQGLLGVEGMKAEVLMDILAPYTVDAPPRTCVELTKADLYALGLSGHVGADEKRKKLSAIFGLPLDLTPNAWLIAVNTLVSKEEWDSVWA